MDSSKSIEPQGTPMNEISSRLACFELWGGNRSADHPVELPGVAGWIYSKPLGPGAGGGDVHYFSVCSKGMVSRVALADVAGPGSGANARAEGLLHVPCHVRKSDARDH